VLKFNWAIDPAAKKVGEDQHADACIVSGGRERTVVARPASQFPPSNLAGFPYGFRLSIWREIKCLIGLAKNIADRGWKVNRMKVLRNEEAEL